MIRNSKQAGAALLSILLIVATLSIAALMATEAIARQTETQKLSARRSAAAWAARSAEAAALVSATAMVGASRLPATGDGADRVRTLVLPLEGGQIILNLRELAPCLNLNALANSDVVIRTQQSTALATLMDDLGIPQSDASSLIAVLTDWIDADAQEQPGGAENSYYLSQQVGLRAADQPFRSPKELAALPGFTAEFRKSISAHTCVVPDTDPIALNLNAFAPDAAYVLRAATGGAMSLAEARRFIDARPATGWKSVQEVADYAETSPTLQQALAGVSVNVQGVFFIGEGRVELDTGSWPFQFMVSTESAGSPKIVWRSFGEIG